MNHNMRSGIAIAFTLVLIRISWLTGHRPADWEYVFLMFVVFSSALQDAMDGMNHSLEKITRLLEESVANAEGLSHEVQQQGENVIREVGQQAENLSREVQQKAEDLKSHITAETNLVKYDLSLMDALQRGEAAPEAPPYPETKFIPTKFVEPKFVTLKSPKLETFDARKFRAERLREVAAALREYGWWDMTVVTSPLRRLVAYIMGREAFLRWLVGR